MPHILSNQDIEVHIDLPRENYPLTRFDWTGKITTVLFKGKYVSGVELADATHDAFCGKGFYNEFGIDSPLGFEEAEIGGWFHKIGVGLLKKTEAPYDFQHVYEVIPAHFDVRVKPNALSMVCQSEAMNGYAYRLEKQIRLTDNGFEIHYHLLNEGEKVIETSEYTHNFLSLDQRPIDKNYVLTLPFSMNVEHMEARVNPDEVVRLGRNEITFNGTPKSPFFYSYLSGKERVPATWTLTNTRSKLGITEMGNFQTQKVNLWGWGHVISPELFFPIHLPPGQSIAWTRAYQVYELNDVT